MLDPGPFQAGAEVVANLAFALLFALLLHSRLIGRGRTLFKLAIFLPVVTPDVAGYVVWRWLYDQTYGALNAALASAHLPIFAGLASTATAMWALLIAELLPQVADVHSHHVVAFRLTLPDRL